MPFYLLRSNNRGGLCEQVLHTILQNLFRLMIAQTAAAVERAAEFRIDIELGRQEVAG